MNKNKPINESLIRLKRNESNSSVQNYFHLDSLQKKLKDLEEENVVLRSEVKHFSRNSNITKSSFTRVT